MKWWNIAANLFVMWLWDAFACIFQFFARFFAVFVRFVRTRHRQSPEIGMTTCVNGYNYADTIYNLQNKERTKEWGARVLDAWKISRRKKKVLTVIWLKFQTKSELCYVHRLQIFEWLSRTVTLSGQHVGLTWYVWKLSRCDFIQWHRHIKLWQYIVVGDVTCRTEQTLLLLFSGGACFRSRMSAENVMIDELQLYSIFSARVRPRQFATSVRRKSKWNRE